LAAIAAAVAAACSEAWSFCRTASRFDAAEDDEPSAWIKSSKDFAAVAAPEVAAPPIPAQIGQAATTELLLQVLTGGEDVEIVSHVGQDARARDLLGRRELMAPEREQARRGHVHTAGARLVQHLSCGLFCRPSS
jgi:hypothetical protein